MAKVAVDHLRAGATAQEAARLAVRTLGERAKALGGIIVVSPKGDLGVSFNTERMSRAYVDPSLTGPVAAIERD
jgi:isoaspartyl peptidase/L-asparaginase-like protein (Ntn-hydrolase superfamily)